MGEYCSLDTLQVATLVSANNHGKKKQQDTSFSTRPWNLGKLGKLHIGCNPPILQAQFLQNRGPLNNKVLTSPSPSSAKGGPVNT